MLSRNRFCLLDGKIHHKSPDHLFDLGFFYSMLYTIDYLPPVLSFLIWVAEVPWKNYLLPAGLFFTGSAMFCFFSVLQTLSLLFLCKIFLAALRISSPSRLSLFPVEVNYFIKDTNLSNQLMMSYVWREFSSVRGKMMKEDAGVPNVQAWGCPHAPPRNIQGDSSV